MLNQSQGQKGNFVDIKEEIKGKAHIVLPFLKINPLALNTQVPCPLGPHHEGRPSFRINSVEGRFYCTICRPRGASLVDLIIELGEAKDFQDAASFLRDALTNEERLDQLRKLFEGKKP